MINHKGLKYKLKNTKYEYYFLKTKLFFKITFLCCKGCEMCDIVRKLAHFGVYFVLGVLMMNAQSISGMRDRKAFILSIVFCVLCAVIDEAHQLFVPGRGVQVMDVLIDSAGAIAGIWLYGIWF